MVSRFKTVTLGRRWWYDLAKIEMTKICGATRLLKVRKSCQTYYQPHQEEELPQNDAAQRKALGRGDSVEKANVSAPSQKRISSFLVPFLSDLTL